MTAAQKPLKPGCSYGVRFSPDGRCLGKVPVAAGGGKGKLLFFGSPGLGVLAQHAFTYPRALDFLPASPVAAIGSWEAGMLMELNRHKETA